MMPAHPQNPEDWRDTLPTPAGRLERDAPLSKLSWFRTGGAADVLFRPTDADDLALILSVCPTDVPKLVVGVGSNLLIRDGGVRGLVVHLGKRFSSVCVDGNSLVVGGGTPDILVANVALDAGLGGLEFLRGIPGTIGGAVAMNAGAYGRDIADVLVSADVVLADGARVTYTCDDLRFGYRSSALPDGAVVVTARLAAKPASRDGIAAEMQRIAQAREATQPLRTRTGGSTFKNPPNAKAWQLIDAAGCRGMMVGDAQVSPLHCNFLINTGQASAADIEALGEQVRARVKAHSGHDLVWEIKRVGAARDL